MTILVITITFLLGELIHRHMARFQQYANDTQLYIPTPDVLSEAVDILSQCLEAVKAWMGTISFS